MPTDPNSTREIVAPNVAFYVEGDDLSGTVVAMQLDGAKMNYLIVRDDLQKPPTWITENEITNSRLVTQV